MVSLRGRRFRPGGLVGAFGVHFGAWSAPGRRSPENLRTAWRDPHIKSLGPKTAPKQPLSMPGLPQSIQVASKIKSLFENNSFQCQNSPSRSRQLPRSNPYLKIAVFNARAHPVDPGRFQDQILTVVNARAPQSTQAASKINSLFENIHFQCQSSPSRSRQLPRSNL